MKKNFTVSLDKESVEKLQKWLATKGLSLSGFLNTLINEHLEAVEIVGDAKSLQDINLGQMLKLYAGMMEGFQKSKQMEKEKEEG